MTAKRRILPGLLALGLAAAALPAGAQLRQYSSPGELALIEVPPKESLEKAIADAAWRAGAFRIQPRLSIGDLERIDNVFDASDATEQERVTDWRATASAGLDVYLPMGEKTTVSTFVRPNYAWWKDNDELRRLNWSYGAAAFGFFDRLSTRLIIKRDETERRLNSELRIPATTRQDSILLDADLRLDGPWQLFGAVARSNSRYPAASALEEQAPDLPSLERDEEITSLGIAYDIPNRINLGLGWRRVDSKFLDDPAGRSNQGSYPFLKLSLPGNRLQVVAEVGLRELVFANSEELGSRDETVGTVQTTWRLGHRTTAAVYGESGVVYSAVDAGSLFNSSRVGTSLTWGKPGGPTVSVFGEFGPDEFEGVDTTTPGRVDDYEVVGLQLLFPVRRRLVLRVGISESDLDSNFDEFDRSLTILSSTVGLDLPKFPF